MPQELKIGLVGLDTSHVPAFTKMLNDPDNEHHLPGARVVAGFPGASMDFDASHSRVEGFTNELRERGVTIADTPEAVAEQADLILMTSVDGRAHRGFFEKLAPAGKPIFVDKPFACSSEDALAMLQTAKKHSVAVMSCSSLRYDEAFVAALADEAQGGVVGVEVWGPCQWKDPIPGLFWYGVHSVDMIVRAMGPGVKRVHGMSSESGDLVQLEWADGRHANFRGMRSGHAGFGGVLHREKGFTAWDYRDSKRPFYYGMLRAILADLPRGRSDVPAADMLESVRVMEAANQSIAQRAVVELAPAPAV